MFKSNQSFGVNREHIEETVKLRRRRPVTMDMIDQANADIDFVESFIDLLSIVSEAEQLDGVRSSAITRMCGQSKIRIDAIKGFIRSLPGCTEVSP